MWLYSFNLHLLEILESFPLSGLKGFFGVKNDWEVNSTSLSLFVVYITSPPQIWEKERFVIILPLNIGWSMQSRGVTLYLRIFWKQFAVKLLGTGAILSNLLQSSLNNCLSRSVLGILIFPFSKYFTCGEPKECHKCHKGMPNASSLSWAMTLRRILFSHLLPLQLPCMF